MNIPKKFNLLGREITVVFNDRLQYDHNWGGAACYNEDKIELLPISDSNPVSLGCLEATFCHELAHFLLYYGGEAINAKNPEEWIHKNEHFVESLGNLLHQFLNTERGSIYDT